MGKRRDSFLARRKLSAAMSSEVASSQMLFDMHCVSINDLLEFDRLPSYDEVAAMGKFVIPDASDKRTVLFVSHQWCSYHHPDPTNRQFKVLQGALRSLLAGREVRPAELLRATRHPGIPSKKNFSSLFKNCLCWIDYACVPQLQARYGSDTHHENDRNRLQAMLSAINSVPAYIQRSSLMCILAPVIAHAEESIDCQFSSWKRRGWCRLEAAVGSLVGKSKYMMLIESESKISIFNPNQMLTRDSVGCGDFSCCTQAHVVVIDGEPTSIPCDKKKIAGVLSNVLDRQLEIRSRHKDLFQYRWILAHGHIILKNLPGLEDRRKYDTWLEFAKAFRFNVGKPLQRVGGRHNCTPLIYAAMANNASVARHLIKCKASVHDTMGTAVGTNCQNYTPLHIIMTVGHGADGKQIFDDLLAAKADPYRYSWGGRLGKKPTSKDPFSCGMVVANEEMVLHYLSCVQPNFLALTAGRASNEVALVGSGNYAMTLACLEHGAIFQSRGGLGMGALGAYCLWPKEYQYTTDCGVLDLLHERNLLGDFDGPLHAQRGSVILPFKIMWHLRHIGLLKNNEVASLVYSIGFGTYFHVAVYRDKPEVVAWLLNNNADPKKTNKRGQTALGLAQELGHARCVSILLGDKTALRRYSMLMNFSSGRFTTRFGARSHSQL